MNYLKISLGFILISTTSFGQIIENDIVIDRWLAIDSAYTLPRYKIFATGDTLELQQSTYKSLVVSKNGKFEYDYLYRYVIRDEQIVTLKYGQLQAILRRIEKLEQKK